MLAFGEASDLIGQKFGKLKTIMKQKLQTSSESSASSSDESDSPNQYQNPYKQQKSKEVSHFSLGYGQTSLINNTKRKTVEIRNPYLNLQSKKQSIRRKSLNSTNQQNQLPMEDTIKCPLLLMLSQSTEMDSKTIEAHLQANFDLNNREAANQGKHEALTQQVADKLKSKFDKLIRKNKNTLHDNHESDSDSEFNLTNDVLTINKKTTGSSTSSSGQEFTPVIRSDQGAYTWQEWIVIISLCKFNSSLQQQLNNQNKASSNSQLRLEHLSRKRLHQSILSGCLSSPQFQEQSLTGEIWKILSNSIRQKESFSVGCYDKFLMIQNSPFQDKIERDVQRTKMPCESSKIQTNKTINNEQSEDKELKDQMFKKKLRNVLHAYSLYDSELGYCQGINYLAATLMRHIQKEEDVFWTLVAIMNDKNWREIYLPGHLKVQQLLQQLNLRLQKSMPTVFEHIRQDEMVTMELVFTSPFLTLFAEGFCSLRHQDTIIELFLLNGEEALLDVLEGAIKLSQHIILAKSDVQLVQYLRKHMIDQVFDNYSVQNVLPKGKYPILQSNNAQLY